MSPVLFFILTTLLPGAALAMWLCSRIIAWTRAVAIVYGLGTAIVTLELFIYFVIARQSFSIGLFWFFSLQAVAAVVYCLCRVPWRRQLIDFPRLKVWSLLLGAAIAGLLFLSFIQAIGKPPVAFDSIAFWAMRAKILLTDGRVNFDSSSLTYLSAYSHSNYPWHVSFLEYWQRLLGGSGGAVNLIAWGYFLSLAVLLGDFLVKRLGAVKGLLLTLFFCSQPLIFYHGSNNYADLIIGYYAAAGFIFFLEWLESGRLSLLCLSAIFFSWTICIKNYGIFYIIALIVGTILAHWLHVRRLGMKDFLKTLTCLALPLLPLGLFKLAFRLNLRNTDPAWVFHPEALHSFGQALFVANNWNIWWAIFIVSGIIGFIVAKNRKQLLIPWIMIAVVILILVFVFTCTENYQWALDHTALSRAFIPLVPISIAVAGFSLRSADASQEK